MLNLQNSINWALPYVQGSPLSAWTAGEPAVSVATLIRNSLLSPPLAWPWNRKEDSSTSTVAGTQDYVIPIVDFGFAEKVSLTDVNGNVYELKDIYNNLPLSATTSTINARSRPMAVSILIVTPGTSIKIRFMQVPDQIYTINVTYQAAPVPFTQNTLTAAGSASAGNTAYTGTFTTSLFPTGQSAMILGFINAVNNGTFTIVSCTSTTLTVANPSGVTETTPAFAINVSWSPIPDYYSDIYNWLFLSESFSADDDPARAQIYRQRGVAAFLAKAEGLTEMQKNAFIQQWLNYTRETQQTGLRLQQGSQARGI